jgi:hypothetical protein
MLPENTYNSIPGLKVPGVLVPQLEQMVLPILHNCTTSNPLIEVTTDKYTCPKPTPSQMVDGTIEFEMAPIAEM